jgi:catechol 2,3-dioxygenase-like lactoylglutathione lyase family enzyme
MGTYSDFCAASSVFFAAYSPKKVTYSDFYAVNSDFCAANSDFLAAYSHFCAAYSDFLLHPRIFLPAEGGFLSQFGTFNGLTIKFVPIRESVDFKNFPSHQLGFAVPDVEHIITLAQQYGGCQEGEVFRDGQQVQAAVRDPDGNSIELYSAVS